MGDMLVANPPPLIRENEAFYGYIIGLWVAPSCRDDDLAENTNRAIYAVFEYNSQRTLYRVPDAELFELLAKHLCAMAWIREKHG